MHSGLARLRDALHGFIAHQARASNPEPSQPLWAERGDLVSTLVACAFGRAARWRSRPALFADGGATEADMLGRLGADDTVRSVAAEPAPGACCAAGLTHIATGSALDAFRGGRAAAGAGPALGSCANGIVALAGGVAVIDDNAGDSVGDGAGAGGAVGDTARAAATSDVATRVAGAESPLAAEARAVGNDGRLRVQAPQANAMRPRNASDSAALT